MLTLTCSCWQALRFCIRLLVRDIAGASAHAFSFQPVQELLNYDIDVGRDDVLHNLVTKDTQLMNGTFPWRGSREKDPLLLQMLIEATTSPGDIVMDCSASIGSIMTFNISIPSCLQLWFESLDDHLMFTYFSSFLLQAHMCMHVERRAGISSH
jgi:hypothetical protein